MAAKNVSVTRRSLVAAGAAVIATLGTKTAQATQAWQATSGSRGGNGRGGGNGHGNGRGSGGGNGGGNGGGVHCYLRGTSILTPSGEREISELEIGELLVTHSGRAKPIKWIGRRRLMRSAAEIWPVDVIPIMIARSALGPEMPNKNLFLSDGHALYVDGLLIQAGSLVNGQTIVRRVPEDATVLDYFQIELFDHDVIYADGAAAETFFGGLADRMLFDNCAEYDALYGGNATAEQVPFAPEICESGLRRQLRSRLRSALSPWVDARRPFDVVRDRIEERAERLKAA